MMEFKPNKTEELLALLKNTQPQSIASPLSAFDLMEIQSKQLSKDPVVANLQKFGRGVQGLLEPETPLDYLGMALPAAKVAKGVAKISKPLYEKMTPGELERAEKFLKYHYLDEYTGKGSKVDTYEVLEDRIVVYWSAGDKLNPEKTVQKTFKTPTVKNLKKYFGY